MYKDGPYIFYSEDHLKERYYYYHPTSSTKEIKEKIIPVENPVTSLKPVFNVEKKVLLSQDFPTHADEYDNVSKIAAFGDIHGEFDLLVSILKNSQIIDEDFCWSFGDGHVVFCGDIFDRGDQVTECLWLIYALEQEARKAGGMIHLLLGNHELMAMENDNRYLSGKYFNMTHLFKTPYSKLYDEDTVLGRWLRSKNVLVQINGYIFVHAGLSPKMVQEGYSIGKINQLTRHYLSGVTIDEDIFLGSEGPFWYRGYLINWTGYKKITSDEVDKILQFYKAAKIIFAHTPVPKIQTCFSNLIAIDVSLEKISPYEFLWIEDGKFSTRNKDGSFRVLYDC
jgi:hypothetical protein